MKKTRIGKRRGTLAVLLAAAVLFTGIGPLSMDVRAETEKVAENPESGTAEALLDAPEVDGETYGPDYEVTYDTVYFGEYPQSEVLTNEMAQKEAGVADWFMYITSEVVVDDTLYGKLEAAEYDEAGETVLEDARYRRIAFAADSSGAEWRYFRYDPIRWRVLCVHDIEYTDRIAECAMLLSDKALDILPFDEKGEGLWEDSSLRKWLNESFVHTAFTEDEYWNDIAIVEAEASDGSFEAYGEDKNSTDDGFALSGYELFGEEAEEYGFMPSKDNTWAGSGEDIARRARATRFALAAEQGDREAGRAEADSDLICWWTRSSVSDTEAGIVDYSGEAGSAGKDMTGIGIRPALWMDLESASNDYVYEGKLVITSEGYKVIDPSDGNGDEEIKEKEEVKEKEEEKEEIKEENEEENEDEEVKEEKEEVKNDEVKEKETEKQQPDKDSTDTEKIGKYSDGMLYTSAEWFLSHLDAEDFDKRVAERLETVDMAEKLPGKWLVFAQTDFNNPANESYDPDTQESYYPLFVQHMKADVTETGTEYRITVDSYEMLDCDTGEIFVEDIIETLTADIGALKNSADEAITFEGSVQIKISRIFKLDDRLYAAGKLTYSSGESVAVCMVREDGASTAGEGEEKENNIKEKEEKTDKTDKTEKTEKTETTEKKDKGAGEVHELDDYPILWTSFNTAGVSNGPSKPTVFTIEEGESWRVYSVMTYHWNDASGATPGTITLLKDGENIAEWQTVGTDGMYNVADANWIAYTDIVLEPGEYEVIDSDRETWSCNSGSGNTGFAELRGEVTAEKAVTSGNNDDPYGDVFDLSEYEDEWIEEYGGDLEDKLAERLQTRVDIGDDGDSTVICDGAIEFYPAVDGSGFFVWVYEPVDRFSVYGISVGMTEDNAVANLKANNLSKQNDGGTGIYSQDFDKYYVSYEAENGIVTKITYVKIYE